MRVAMVLATVLDAPLQAWCWNVCRPWMPRRADGRAYCIYECITGGPAPLRRLLWWIVDNSAFWSTPAPEAP